MYSEFLVTKCLKMCWKFYLTQRFPEYINVVVQSFLGGLPGGGGRGGGGVKFINFTLFRYQTDSLWGHEVRQTDSLIMIHHHNLKQRENY